MRPLLQRCTRFLCFRPGGSHSVSPLSCCSCAGSHHFSRPQLPKECLLSPVSPTPVLEYSAYQRQSSLKPSLFPSPCEPALQPADSLFLFSLFSCCLLFSAVQNSVLPPTSKPSPVTLQNIPFVPARPLSSLAPCKYTWLHILIQGIPFPWTCL